MEVYLGDSHHEIIRVQDSEGRKENKLRMVGLHKTRFEQTQQNSDQDPTREKFKGKQNPGQPIVS